MFNNLKFLSLFFIIATSIYGQNQTVGVFLNDERAFRGYTLFAPLPSRVTYLIDNEGRQINKWVSDYPPGLSVYLLENGHLLRSAAPPNDAFNVGGRGGGVQEFDWDGNLVWEFIYSDSTLRAHHDIEYLPNGNIMMLAWEMKSREESIAAGRDLNLLDADQLWPDHIIEVQPSGATGGEIVWRWHAWDHLIQDYDSTKANYGIVEEHPELIDLNYAANGGPDWLHLNSIDYNAELDQIVVSSPLLNEIWIIDHSTTTEEAAGHTGGRSNKGGDLLFRWGNPKAYRAGDSLDQKLFFQHDPNWIEPDAPGGGNILIFNNGNRRPAGNFSSIEEIVTPIDENGNYRMSPEGAFLPEEPVWSFTTGEPTDFYSGFISGAQRLANGNTLICSGSVGEFFEVTPEGDIVWRYVNPVTSDGPIHQGEPIAEGSSNIVFRSYRYAPDYPAFAGRDLTPGDVIELPPTSVRLAENTLPESISLGQNFPNPFNPTTAIPFELNAAAEVSLSIFNLKGQLVGKPINSRKFLAGKHEVFFDGAMLSSGIYLYRLNVGSNSLVRKMTILR